MDVRMAVAAAGHHSHRTPNVKVVESAAEMCEALVDSATQTGELDFRDLRPAGSLCLDVKMSSLQRVLLSEVEKTISRMLRVAGVPAVAGAAAVKEEVASECAHVDTYVAACAAEVLAQEVHEADGLEQSKHCSCRCGHGGSARRGKACRSFGNFTCSEQVTQVEEEQKGWQDSQGQ